MRDLREGLVAVVRRFASGELAPDAFWEYLWSLVQPMAGEVGAHKELYEAAWLLCCEMDAGHRSVREVQDEIARLLVDVYGDGDEDGDSSRRCWGSERKE